MLGIDINVASQAGQTVCKLKNDALVIGAGERTVCTHA